MWVNIPYMDPMGLDEISFKDPPPASFDTPSLRKNYNTPRKNTRQFPPFNQLWKESFSSLLV